MQGYQRAKLVTPDEVALLKALERQVRPRSADLFWIPLCLQA